MNSEFFAVEIPEVIQMKQPDKKERQKQYFKKWYEDKIKTQKKRVVCECGIEVCYMHLCNHKKSKRHKKLIKEKSENNP